jgi:hypothetical protein
MTAPPGLQDYEAVRSCTAQQILATEPEAIQSIAEQKASCLDIGIIFSETLNRFYLIGASL